MTHDPAPDSDSLTAPLLATAAGDRLAFRHLYEATTGTMFAHALRLLRRRDAAEDALQEGYLRLWSNARSFDPARGRAMPWIARIIRNTAIDRLRQDRAGMEVLNDHAETLPAHPVPFAGLAVDMQRALASPSANQRNAILLFYVHGLTCQEIAAPLDVPLGTVKSWIHRGAGRLARYFVAADSAFHLRHAA